MKPPAATRAKAIASGMVGERKRNFTSTLCQLVKMKISTPSQGRKACGHRITGWSAVRSPDRSDRVRRVTQSRPVQPCPRAVRCGGGNRRSRKGRSDHRPVRRDDMAWCGVHRPLPPGPGSGGRTTGNWTLPSGVCLRPVPKVPEPGCSRTVALSGPPSCRPEWLDFASDRLRRRRSRVAPDSVSRRQGLRFDGCEIAHQSSQKRWKR